MRGGYVRRFDEVKLAHYVAPGAWQRRGNFLVAGLAACHYITMNHDVKARRCNALTLAVGYLTLIVFCKRHTFRKKGSQSHRSKGFPMTAGLPEWTTTR
jgi:hypothetical protein